MTSSTETNAKAMAISTSRSAASMDRPLSMAMRSDAPFGRVGVMRSISVRTPRTTSSTLALDCASMPMPMPARPLVRIIVRSFSAATLTSATSPRRTRCPSGPRPMTRLRKSPALSRPTSVRSANSRVRDSSRPAGSSTFSRRSAPSMSATVSERAASAWRSIQTRIAARRAPDRLARDTPGTVERRSTR